MPTRPREHQLEGISIRFFEGLLPPQWVCRRKDSDYGVDLEVEVFEDDGRSTSLTFIVQIKATDDLKKERSMSITLDRLRYLAGHDAPSMIVRYCEPAKTLNFMWISNVFAQIGNPETKTVTVNFNASDAWSFDTPQAVHRTLKVYRKLRHPSSNVSIGLTAETDGMCAEERFVLKHAVSQICDATGAVVSSSDYSECVPVSVWIDQNVLRVEIDVITSVTDQLDDITTPYILSSLVYALAFLTGQYGFKSQFRDLVRLIHERDFTTHSRFVAAAVAGFALDRPEISADLASRNGLHNVPDVHYWDYFNSIMKSELPVEERKPAVERLISETITSNLNLPESEQAAFHYNLANFYMNSGDYLSAVRQFNVARKKASIYLKRPYFLRELAACLFFNRRYAKAAELYLVAFEIDGGSQVGICAGDALLYSGHFAVATDTYQRTIEFAVSEEKAFDQSEAMLKVWLSEWVAEFYNVNEWTDKGRLSDRETWMNVIDSSLSNDRFDDALAAALMEGFLADGDEGLWADAVAFAFNTEDTQLWYATLSCAIWRCGYEVYAKFRNSMKESGVSPTFIEHLDELVESFVEQRAAQKASGYTMRFVNTEDVKALFELVV